MAGKRIHIHLQLHGRGPIGSVIVHADEHVVRMLTRRLKLGREDRDPRAAQESLVGALAERLCFAINDEATVVHAFEAREPGGEA